MGKVLTRSAGKSYRPTHLVALLLATTAASGPAFAQALPSPANPVPPAEASPSAATSQRAPALEEVVVTAQKRSQRLQDVPIAVTALSSSQLARAAITRTDDLTQVTPGLVFSQTATFAQPVIRGVGSESTGLGDESNVATYIDGVYMARMLGNFFELTGVQDIEILKGPQGTLFGRNATGGAINITTLAPSDVTTGDFSVGYGSHNDSVLKAYLSGPLTDTLSGNIAVYQEWRDGFYDQQYLNQGPTNSLNSTAVRAKLRFQPNSDVTITGEFDYEKSNDATGVATQPLNGDTIGAALGAPIVTKPYDVSTGERPTNNVYQYGGYLKADVNLDFARLVSITAGRYNYDYIQDDVDGTEAQVFNFKDTELSSNVQQEVQLLSPRGGPLSWILGIYYFHDSSRYDPLEEIVSGVPIASVTADITTDSVAGYADATYQITDQLSISGGGRYSSETKSYNAADSGFQVIGKDSATFSDFTPRGVVSYKPVKDVLLYLSYSQGFKSGEFNPSSFQLAPVAPEKIKAYEAGTKIELFNRMTLDGSVFYYDYTNLQVQALIPPSGSAILENAASAHVHGADLQGNVAIAPGLNGNFGVAWLSGHYSSFPDASVTIPYSPFGNIQESLNVSGNTLVRAPKWTANVGADYTVDLESHGDLQFSGNLYYSTNYYWDPLNRISQGSHSTVNVQARYRFPGHHWYITATGTNITDSRSYSTVTTSSLGDQVAYADPALYLVTVGYRF